MVGLVFTAGLDGAALVLISNLLNERTETAGDLPTGHIAFIAACVIGLFLLRSASAVAISWRTTIRLAMEEVKVGSENFDAYSEQQWEAAQKLNVSDLYSIVDRGPYALVSGILFYFSTLVAELASASVIFLVILVLQPVTAVTAALFFIGLAVVQHKMLSVSSERAGRAILERGNSVYEILGDTFSLKRVLSVSPSQSLTAVLADHRKKYALARAKLLFFETLPRYVMEASLAIGFVVIGLATYAIQGRDLVVPSLTVFAAAGFRLLPIINRIQGLVLAIVGRLAFSDSALGYWDDAQTSAHREPTANEAVPLGEDVVLALDDVSYRYPDADSDSLTGASLQFCAGLQYAIVGPSGSGKTTLVELCLGLREPTTGSVRVGASSLTRGYVPQDTHMAGVPVLNNVALEWDSSKVDVKKAESALSNASLSGALEGRDLSDVVQGLSGGQLQRLGLARALYRDPNFLVLDEATNALDATTEASIIESLELLRGKITVLLVAHRLSTVRNADLVVYVEEGRIVYSGTFVDVYNSVPAFAHQVDLGRFDIE
ncbi:MAG: ABC transporter ATP-binding protein/permease [Actinomycetia bacterium]|nr:ABC transporter ATP-binding protein/permease [Actinomycetes bacterium]